MDVGRLHTRELVFFIKVVSLQFKRGVVEGGVERRPQTASGTGASEDDLPAQELLACLQVLHYSCCDANALLPGASCY